MCAIQYDRPADSAETDGLQLDGPDGLTLLVALQAMRDGDFQVRLPVAGQGITAAIAETFNEIVELNLRTAAELSPRQPRGRTRGANRPSCCDRLDWRVGAQ